MIDGRLRDRGFESLSLRHFSAIFSNKYAICIFQKGVRKVYVRFNSPGKA
jgi:hypothetical protein